MKKIDTQEAIASTLKKGMEIAKRSGINVSEDEFTVIQPFDDLNAVMVTVEKDTEGARSVKVKVTDAVVILERQEGILDVFK
ncbi:2-hydroxyacyl-CoA dehydratase [Enterococcus faecalis]|uniref:2-hydroxyacyl-CoA dehydratase n=1 Tax=Enterococcus sp. FR128 TaxID=2923500 RepID=UPI001920F201|nr:2-hydroxyacyl-CoA dehydratase [Enterococcus sp. FR128]MDQ8673483.1 2-hydroxyacyl-CoA dehydratase [Enterococcus sp. FR128]QTI52998.1 2-hydroxyacyl-CoA dehydratase [Enterococcus faecalis]